MSIKFLAYPKCHHSTEKKESYSNHSSQKARLFCKLPYISESIDKYESQGYYITGILVDDDSPIVEILYNSDLSNPKPPDHIHAGIKEYIDEEIPRTYPREETQ